MTRPTTSLALAGLLLTAVGCGQPSAQATATNTSATASIDAAKYILPQEPEGAVGIIEAREEAKDQQEILMVGCIGGQKNPWIEGRAAFTLIDATMRVVADGQQSSGDEICLEGCCASTLAECTALIKVVDEQGRILSIDARNLLGVKIDDMVVVRGRVQRDEEGSFSVMADGVYVRK